MLVITSDVCQNGLENLSIVAPVHVHQPFFLAWLVCSTVRHWNTENALMPQKTIHWWNVEFHMHAWDVSTFVRVGNDCVCATFPPDHVPSLNLSHFKHLYNWWLRTWDTKAKAINFDLILRYFLGFVSPAFQKNLPIASKENLFFSYKPIPWLVLFLMLTT